MPRGQRRKPQATAEEAQQQPEAVSGHNSDPQVAEGERLRRFERDYLAATAKCKAANDARTAICKAATSDGLDVAEAKRVLKIKEMTAPEMRAKTQTFTRYTTQLGIFDIIESFRAAEEMEANKASADVAERENARPQSGNASAEPKSGGTEDAIYAQGFQAGEEDAPRNEHGYHGEQAETWQRGWHAGAMKRVDATNSEMAGASA